MNDFWTSLKALTPARTDTDGALGREGEYVTKLVKNKN